MPLTKSERLKTALSKMGLFSWKDIILHLPKRYEDYSPTRETNLENKERIVVYGKIISPATLARYSGASVTKFAILTSKNHIFLVDAWNRPYLAKNIKQDDFYTIIGNYDSKKNIVNLISLTKGEILPENYLKPVYTLNKDIDQHEYIRLVHKAFSMCEGEIIDEVPVSLKKKYRLIDKWDALKQAHFPTSKNAIKEAYRYLKYEECLKFSLKTLLIKEENNSIIKTNSDPIKYEDIANFTKDLRFKLTRDQRFAAKEIIDDMNLDRSMYRLLQGDVGSGKTIVVAIALYGNYLRGQIGAFMVPTEALARQHYKTLTSLLTPYGVKVGLLLGSFTTSERSQVRKLLRNGYLDIIVGTHALFSQDIDYYSLGLVVIDEQHKFGVNQRNLLINKGVNADLLMLSATPIPRSLALTIYGELDVSTLLTFPFEKRDIETSIVKSKDKVIGNLINQSITSGGRVYVIAPRIEEGEGVSATQLYEQYKKKYLGLVSLLHGRLDQDDKNFALKDFRDGARPILISTSVVEVGIDVKEADLMIVYDASSFGLASLHQLRGRIGRNGQKAHFLLVEDSNDEEAIEKLQILVDSNDGFKISEEDLKRRGPGDMLGTRQSGIIDFAYLNVIDDYKMFVVAKEDAKEILRSRHKEEYKRLLEEIKVYLKGNNYLNS